MKMACRAAHVGSHTKPRTLRMVISFAYSCLCHRHTRTHSLSLSLPLPLSLCVSSFSLCLSLSLSVSLSLSLSPPLSLLALPYSLCLPSLCLSVCRCPQAVAECYQPRILLRSAYECRMRCLPPAVYLPPPSHRAQPLGLMERKGQLPLAKTSRKPTLTL